MTSMKVLPACSSDASSHRDGGHRLDPDPSHSTNKQRANPRSLGSSPPITMGKVVTRTPATPTIPELPASSTAPWAETPKRVRRGHTKSRGGCFTCKRLKIKCKENRPDCDYCAHRGLACEWPKPAVKKGQASALIQRPLVPTQATVPAPALLPQVIQSEVPVFTMLDFRLFNYFIQRAHPQHPRGSKEVWQHDIPCLASSYDYLLHSMLALAASELALTERLPQQLHNAALTHRTRSISCLNMAIQRGVNSFEEGNAMLATCFSLLFQSTLISDGLVEYMTFMRGTVVVASQMCGAQMRFLFEELAEMSGKQAAGGDVFEEVDQQDRPVIHPRLVDGACRSFEKFESLCRSRSEIMLFDALYEIARSLYSASASAYLKLRRVYRIFACTMPHADFRHYCDPSNQVGQILQAHFVALQLIMNPITLHTDAKANAQTRELNADLDRESNGPRCPVKEGSRRATKGWLAAVHRDVKDEWREYFEWTMWIECEIARGRIFDGRVGEEDGDVGVEDACPFRRNDLER